MSKQKGMADDELMMMMNNGKREGVRESPLQFSLIVVARGGARTMRILEDHTVQ